MSLYIPRVNKSNKYDTSVSDRSLILSSESAQKLIYGRDLSRHASMMVSILSYPLRCHSSPGRWLARAHVRLPSMMKAICWSILYTKRYREYSKARTKSNAKNRDLLFVRRRIEYVSSNDVSSYRVPRDSVSHRPKERYQKRRFIFSLF